MYSRFQWYAANLVRIRMVRRKSIPASRGTQQIWIGFQWYAANLFRLPVVVGGGWWVELLLIVSSLERKPSQLAVWPQAGSAGIQHRRTHPTLRLCCLVFFETFFNLCFKIIA